MRITESKLRKLVREVILELTGTRTARGAQKKGYQSKETKKAQQDYDTKVADYKTKTQDYNTKKSDLEGFAGRRFRKADPKSRGSYIYTAGPVALGMGWSTNPDWTTKNTAKSNAERAKNSAETARDSSLRVLDTKKAADLKKEKTPSKEKVQTGGAGGRGKGKGRGGKGKKDKK